MKTPKNLVQDLDAPVIPTTRVVSLSEFEQGVAAVVNWFAQPMFPEAGLFTDIFHVECEVEDERPGEINEYRTSFTCMTGDRDPDWFSHAAAFAAVLARNIGGDHLRKTSLVVGYTEFGFAITIKCIVPKLKLELQA